MSDKERATTVKCEIKDVSIVKLVKHSYMVVHVNTSQIQQLEIKRPTQQ